MANSNFTEDSKPYELLFRWGANGAIQGAHIGFLDIILKDGQIISQTPRAVESVAIAEQAGFPLNDALDLVHIGLVKQAEALAVQAAQLTADKEVLVNHVNELTALYNTLVVNTNEVFAANAAQATEITGLNEEIARLTALIPRE